MQRNFTKTQATFDIHRFYLEDVVNWHYTEQITNEDPKTNKIKVRQGLVIGITCGMTAKELYVFKPKTIVKKFDKMMSDYTKKQLAEPRNKFLLD